MQPWEYPQTTWRSISRAKIRPEVRFNSSERPASFLSADTTFEKTPAADAPWTTLVEDRHYDRPSQFDLLVHPKLARWHTAKYSEKQVRL